MAVMNSELIAACYRSILSLLIVAFRVSEGNLVVGKLGKHGLSSSLYAVPTPKMSTLSSLEQKKIGSTASYN